MSVYVFLNDSYADWELGYLLPELTCEPDDPRIKKNKRKVVTFSIDGKPLRSMGSLNVLPDKSLGEVAISDVEALILPGGEFWQNFAHQALDTLVKQVVANGKVLAGICAATVYLGRLGLLDTVEHTSNSLQFLTACAPNYRGAAQYRNELAVAHRNIVTASGLGAIEFTDKLIRLLEVYEAPVCDVWFNAFKNGVDPFISSNPH